MKNFLHLLKSPQEVKTLCLKAITNLFNGKNFFVSKISKKNLTANKVARIKKLKI